MALVSRGTKIICPRCKRHITTVMVDIEQGMAIDESFFGGGLQVIKNGDETRCDECGAPYMFFESIRTEGGWVPDDWTDKGVIDAT